MLEIEHKYIVINDSFRALAERSIEITQGYLNRDPDRVVRVRTIVDTSANGGSLLKSYITIKGRTVEDSRLEFEYQIPFEDASQLLNLCECKPIHKIRHIVFYEGHKWEVDEFLSHEKGLIVAEIELEDSNHDYALPPFVGEEVTGQPKYYNSNL